MSLIFNRSLDQAADNFLKNLTIVLKASTQPLHQFIPWWKRVPLPQNRRLCQALDEVHQFLAELIEQSPNTQLHPEHRTANVLDKLLAMARTEPGHASHSHLTKKEIKDLRE